MDLGGGGSINEKTLTMDMPLVRSWKWTLLSFLRGGKETLVGTPWKTIWMEVSGGDVQLEEEYKPAVG